MSSQRLWDLDTFYIVRGLSPHTAASDKIHYSTPRTRHQKIESYIHPHPSPPGCILPLSHASVLHHAVAACASLAAFQTAFLLPLTPSLSLSSTGTVISHEIQASVTDWPHLRPARPEGGMSCRPSTRLDSSMTPIIIEEVSADSSCWAYLKRRLVLKTDIDGEKVDETYDILGDVDLAAVLLRAVAVTAVDLGSHNRSVNSIGIYINEQSHG